MSDDSTTPSLTEFPNAPVSWSPQDSETIAEAEGLDLTADHWEVIQALQEYFARNDGPVKVRELQDALHERFHQITPGDRADPGSGRGVVPLSTTQSTAR